jgi:tyrosine-protein kinase Etk/Wzc
VKANPSGFTTASTTASKFDTQAAQAAEPQRSTSTFSAPRERRAANANRMARMPKWWWYRNYVMAVPAAAAVLACVVVQFVPPRFTATARLLPPQANQNSAQIIATRTNSNAGLGMAAMGAKNPSEVYAQLFLSRSVQDQAIQTLKLGEHYKLTDPDEIRGQLETSTVANVNKAGLIELSVTDHNAQRSAEITNALISGMYTVGLRVTQEAARRQTEFYDNLIAETRERLRKADDQLMAVEARGGLTRLKGQEEATTATIVALKNSIADREVELARLRRYATDQQPDVQRARAELSALHSQLATVEKPLARRQSDILVAPADYPELRRLVEPARREVESLSSVLNQLQRNREASRIDDSRDLTTIVVLDQAITPSKKSWPVTSRVAFSAFAGALLIALGIAFASSISGKSTLTNRRKSPLTMAA